MTAESPVTPLRSGFRPPIRSPDLLRTSTPPATVPPAPTPNPSTPPPRPQSSTSPLSFAEELSAELAPGLDLASRGLAQKFDGDETIDDLDAIPDFNDSPKQLPGTTAPNPTTTSATTAPAPTTATEPKPTAEAAAKPRKSLGGRAAQERKPILKMPSAYG